MNVRTTSREVWVGLVMIAALTGLVGLLAMAGGGPGYLSSSGTFDVVFRDGQGIRAGSPVRIAGLDAGRVIDVDLTEDEGALCARVRLSLPTHLLRRLRQDVKVTIQSNLTGQSRLNVVSSGRSTVSLVSGQVVRGVETTFFDPILEQVGLGPVERSHLSHTIAEVRQTVDSAGPRIRQIMGSLQQTATGFRESADAIRPALVATATHIEDLVRRIDSSAPKVETALKRLDSLTFQADGLIQENRPNIQAAVVNLRDLTATVQDIAAKDRGKVERLLDGLDGTRLRADRVLYQADLIAGQGLQVITRNRADMERTVANVRDATDWGKKLVQKIYANPFVLSPFYKPTPEDTRVQVVYDTAQVFTNGAEELHDALRTFESMSARPLTPALRQELTQIQQNLLGLTNQLNQTSQLLAEGLKRPPRETRSRR